MSAEPAMAGRAGFLLLRQAGGCWGVAGASVRAVERVGDGFVVKLEHGGVVAEEVLGMVENLVVLPLVLAAGGDWPAGAIGVAVHDGQPLVVVDSRRPPRALARVAEAVS